jgi:t-SNARE complex subunit (syntaxin)
MSSRKKLKKDINNTFEMLYVDCFFYKVYVVNADQDAADKVLKKIVDAQDDVLSRINITEGKEVKGRVKAYYKNLRKQLKEQIDAIGKDIEALPL